MKTIKGTDYRDYQAIHYWLRKNYGKADKCKNEDCEGISNTYSWSLKKGLGYEYKRENFEMLCRSCHAKLDMTESGKKRISKYHKGRSSRRRNPINCEVCGVIIENGGGRQKYCKDCGKIMARKKEREWVENNREKVRGYKRAYYKKYLSQQETGEQQPSNKSKKGQHE